MIQKSQSLGLGVPYTNSLGTLGPKDSQHTPEIDKNLENGLISTPMARQKLSMSGIPIARRAEAIGRGPGPWKEAQDPTNGVGGMAKLLNKQF